MSDRERVEHGIGLWARDCPHCRERGSGGDPADWLGVLRHVPVPEATLDEVSASVAAALRAEPPSRERSARVFPWLPRPVAWAAALLGAALLAVAIYRLPAGPGERRPLVVSGPPAGAGTPRARVEVLAPPSAAPVVDLTVGEIQVVMVFSEDLEL